MNFLGFSRQFVFDLISLGASLAVGIVAGLYSPAPYSIAIGIWSSAVLFVAFQIYEGVHQTKETESRVRGIKNSVEQVVANHLESTARSIKADIDVIKGLQRQLNENFTILHKVSEIAVRHSLTDDAFRGILCITEELCAIYEANLGHEDFFSRHIKNRIKDLHDVTIDARHSKRLRVIDDHIRNLDEILELLNSGEDKTWKFTWHLDNDDRLLSPQEWHDFFREMIFDQRASSLIVSIAMIGDPSPNRLPAFEALKALVDVLPGWSLIKVPETSYQNVVADNRAVQAHADFAIFGGRLLYVAQSYANRIDAYYHSGERQLEAFKQLFATVERNGTVVSQRSSATERDHSKMQKAFENLLHSDK